LKQIRLTVDVTFENVPVVNAGQSWFARVANYNPAFELGNVYF